MLNDYGILLENDSNLTEFLVFIYENEQVIADIDIPWEWLPLIDESYDKDGNKYYILTNRAISLLEMGVGTAKFLSKVGSGVNKVKNFGNKAVMGGMKTIDKASHGADKITNKVAGKKLGSKLNKIRKTVSGAAGHVGAELATHNPMAASAIHDTYHHAKKLSGYH